MEPDGPSNALMQMLYDSSIATAIRESGTLFPWIESTHVLMIAIVVGTIAIVDLRLIGFSAHRRGARQLIVDMLPFTWVAFVLAIVTAAVPKPVLFKIFSGLAAGLSSAQLDPFIQNMHTALWVLAATSVVGAGVSLLRPRHVSAGEVQWAEG